MRNSVSSRPPPSSVLPTNQVILIVSFASWSLPLAEISMGFTSEVIGGKPWNKDMMKAKLFASGCPPSLSLFRTYSSREDRMLCKIRGEPFQANRRSASRMEDFPVLFLPVMRVTRPNPPMERSLMALNPLIDRSDTRKEWPGVVSIIKWLPSLRCVRSSQKCTRFLLPRHL